MDPLTVCVLLAQSRPRYQCYISCTDHFCCIAPEKAMNEETVLTLYLVQFSVAYIRMTNIMHIAALPAVFIHVKLASYTCIIQLTTTQMLTYCSEYYTSSHKNCCITLMDRHNTLIENQIYMQHALSVHHFGSYLIQRVNPRLPEQHQLHGCTGRRFCCAATPRTWLNTRA